MNSKLIKILIIICLTLMSIIALEWLYATQAQKQLLTAISSPEKQTLIDEMPAIDLNTQSEESYADIVNRPLFIAGRKPVPETESAQTTVVTNTFDWRLSGVYSTKKGLMALLTRTVAKPLDPTGKTHASNYKKVIVGDDVEGWKVTGIHANELILSHGEAEKKLPLRMPKAKKPQGQNDSIPSNSHAITPTPAPATTPEAVPEPQVEPET